MVSCSFGNSILGDWEDLVIRLDRTGVTARWAASDPALAALTSAAQLATWCHCREATHTDTILAALVRLAAADGGDEADAVLVLLHVLAPGASRVAQQVRYLCGSDAENVVVSELTVQIRRFPWQRRTRAIAANLLLDTRSSVIRHERRSSAKAVMEEVALDPSELSEVIRLVPAAPEPEDVVNLPELLGWAQQCGVISAEDVRLMTDLSREDLAIESAPAARLDRPELRLAASRGVSVRTIERHRARTLTALRHARQDYLAAVA